VSNRGAYYNLPPESQPETLPVITQAVFDNWHPLRFRAWGPRERYYDEEQREPPPRPPPPE